MKVTMKLDNTLLQSGFAFPEGLGLPRALDFPEKVIQFGEGNFLRAFVDWMIHLANQKGRFKGRVVLVQPIAQGLIEAVNAQDGLYTLFLRGIQDGKIVQRREIISAVSRGVNPYEKWADYLALADNPEITVVVSNTTEAGIAYVEEPLDPEKTPASFPGKLTLLLHRRFTRFDGAADKGFLILPCELIDRNGDQLLAVILKLCDHWRLGAEFKQWVSRHNFFCNTLVDRIVTGYPRNEARKLEEELGYEDALMDTGEIFHLWVIEGDPDQQHLRDDPRQQHDQTEPCERPGQSAG
jgi:tagaturonate reductase